MKLFLAVAVLVLALAAHTDAQQASMEDRFSTFQTQVREMTEDLTEKTKAALDQFQNSEFAVKTKNWFTEQFQVMKDQIDSIVPKQ